MREHDEFAVLVNVKHIFDSDAQLFFRNVDSGFQRKDHAFIQRSGLIGVVHVQPNMMSQPMDEVLAQRIAMQIFSMRIDVIEGHFVQRVIVRTAFKFRFSNLKCLDRSVLRAEDDVVDLTLAGRELAVDRGGTRDVRGAGA